MFPSPGHKSVYYETLVRGQVLCEITALRKSRGGSGSEENRDNLLRARLNGGQLESTSKHREMRWRDLSGLVPHLWCVFHLLPEATFELFPPLKKFWLWQFFSFFFFPPTATSVLRRSAANNQHILTGIIALCALLPASQPLEAYFRMNPADTHLFSEPTPTSSDPGPVWFYWDTIASLSAPFFFL